MAYLSITSKNNMQVRKFTLLFVPTMAKNIDLGGGNLDPYNINIQSRGYKVMGKQNIFYYISVNCTGRWGKLEFS